MAGISELEESRRQLSTIAWLRWRLFVHSLRGRGKRGELISLLIIIPIIGITWMVPCIACAYGGYQFVRGGRDQLPSLLLWIIFLIWQMVGLNTSSAAINFEFGTLSRFPIRYRDYFIARLGFGLLDMPNILGGACLLAMAVGIGLAHGSLLRWSALVLLLYGASNLLLMRMIYSWFERWLAQRRTRELVAGILILFSVSMQGIGPLIRHLASRSYPIANKPAVLAFEHAAVVLSRFLPPGLGATALVHMRRAEPIQAYAALAGLTIYVAAYLLALHFRFRSQYLGENLSELPPAAVPRPPILAKVRHGLTASTHTVIGVSPAEVSLFETLRAGLAKEFRYLLRSGPMLYNLLAPPLVFLIFSLRGAGPGAREISTSMHGKYLFAYGCAYAQLVTAPMLYNAFGADRTGFQFYLLAPVRLRDVLLAKNLLCGMILAAEAALMYIVVLLVSVAPPPLLTLAIVAWLLFAFVVQCSIGNLRSFQAPFRVEFSKLRSQRVNRLSSFISLGVTAGMLGIGILVLYLFRSAGDGRWIAGLFSMLALLALLLFTWMLSRIDEIAAARRPEMLQELCRV